MRDPLDELKNLGDNLDARPLPPAEVRRRGNRMRRRRTLGQAVAAAAAVAVVVSGGAFAAGNLTDATPPPGPASQRPTPTQGPTPEDVDWVTTVPDDLGQALFDSLPAPVEGEDTYTFADKKTPWKALPCGDVVEDAFPTLGETWHPGLDDKRTDQRFNLIEPPAETHARQLVVYRDGETATSIVEAIREQTESCGPLESIPGAAELRWSARPFDFGGDEGLLLAGGEFAVDSDARGVGRQLIGLVRQGNAVLTITLADESSSPLEDLTEPDAARVVELATRFAGEMCVFAAEGCGDAPAPERPEATQTAAQLPYMIGPDQLVDTTGLEGWEVVEDGFGPAMVCAEDSTEALAGDRTTTMHFAVTQRGSVRAMATATVLDFGATSYASQPGPEAFSTAADWLETCDEPVDREHRIFSAGDAYGVLHNSQSAAGAGGLRLWRTVMSTAPERCVECDAAWNNHQGVALARGGRLVLLQVSLPGDLQLSVDESTSPMPKLLDVAAELAADGGPHPDDATEEAELLTLGPGALGPIGLGMSLEDLEAGELVRGTPQSCEGFDATALEGRIDGYASQTWGVEAIFARPPVRTPEGIGFDSTRAEVEEVYGELTPSSVRQGWLTPVPGSSGRSYSFDWDPDGRMTEMALLSDNGDCLG